MRHLYVIIASLAFLAAGCRSQPGAGATIGGLPVVASVSGHPLVPKWVFKQLVAANRKVLGQARGKVHSLGDGLPVARAVSVLPITAVAKQDGWYFYATATFTDATTQQPVGFISGLAIRRGTREIIGWSMW